MAWNDPVYAICSGDCSREKKLITYKRKNLCVRCNDQRKRLAKKNQKRVNPVSANNSRLRSKPSGQAALFEAILATRPVVSFITGKALGKYDLRNYCCMSHCLPKGKYPKFKLYDKNIVLLSYDEHRKWDDAFEKKKLKTDPAWSKLFALEEELLSEYEDQVHRESLHYEDI